MSFFEPETQVVDFCAPLPRLAAFIGRNAANLGFDGIECGDGARASVAIDAGVFTWIS